MSAVHQEASSETNFTKYHDLTNSLRPLVSVQLRSQRTGLSEVGFTMRIYTRDGMCLTRVASEGKKKTTIGQICNGHLLTDSND